MYNDIHGISHSSHLTGSRQSSMGALYCSESISGDTMLLVVVLFSAFTGRSSTCKFTGPRKMQHLIKSHCHV